MDKALKTEATPLLVAAFNGHTECLQLLVCRGLGDDATGLCGGDWGMGCRKVVFFS